MTDELPTSRGMYTGGELLGKLTLAGWESHSTLTKLEGLPRAAKYVLFQKGPGFTDLMLREIEAFGPSALTTTTTKLASYCGYVMQYILLINCYQGLSLAK